MKAIHFILILFVISFCMMGCEEGCDGGDCIAVVRGRALNSKTDEPIANAEVRARDEIAITDANGEFEFTINLEQYILDFIRFEINAEGYLKKDERKRVVADINSGLEFDFRLVPEDRLIYSPNVIELLSNENEKEVNVINLGVNDVSVLVKPLNNWITVSPAIGAVRSNDDFIFSVSTNVPPLGCQQQGSIEIRQLNKNLRDTIEVFQFQEDNEIPLADFDLDQGTLFQFDSITFDASSSVDNCEGFFPIEVRWRWDQGQGFTNWEQGRVKKHAYSDFGSKTVTLEVKDFAGNVSSTSQQIDISIAPTGPVVELGDIFETDSLSLVVTALILDVGQLATQILSHGVVWSSNNDMPTLENSLGFTEESDQVSQLSFTSEIQGLRIDQTYYIRAFARNENGVGYSQEVRQVTPDLLDMVLVQNGTFRMGDDAETNDDNSPEHDVILTTDFFISRYEITNQQYAVFLNDEGDLSSNVLNWINLNDPKCRIGFQNNKFVVENGFESHPVVSVSWDGANAFCDWIGGNLPTEAQWEYAARGGNSVNSSDYTLYSGSNSPGLVAFYSVNSDDKVHAVGQKEPNELGLYDMSGNVSEWCRDWYRDDYYGVADLVNPTGPLSGDKKVARGGNFGVPAELITVFYREKRTPSIQNNFFGFRCIK